MLLNFRSIYFIGQICFYVVLYHIYTIPTQADLELIPKPLENPKYFLIVQKKYWILIQRN